jgi:hypothetical protein
MNMCSKFGYNKVVLHTMKTMLHICEICTRRQWEALRICWSRSQNQVAWFLLVNYQMDPNGVVDPKMDHLVCYAFWSNPTLEKIREFAINGKMIVCILTCCP